MNRSAGRFADVAIPAVALASMRTALALQAGADGAARALQQAGRAAGDVIFQALGPEVNDASADRYFQRIAQFFASRGWGTLQHDAAHPGIASLSATHWAESSAGTDEPRPSCFFTTGMLANLLGHTAGSEVAVIETECRSHGDARCRFLYGSPAALDALYERLAAGSNAEDALSQLT